MVSGIGSLCQPLSPSGASPTREVSRCDATRASTRSSRPARRGGRPRKRDRGLPDEAARKRHVETRLLDVVTRWGYREVVTPTFEFAEVLATGTDVRLQEAMFKLVDRETGRTLALRADITPQIARVVATRMREEPKPLRLAYVANVFRYDEPQVAHYRELSQAGVELVGDERNAEAQRTRRQRIERHLGTTSGRQRVWRQGRREYTSRVGSDRGHLPRQPDPGQSAQFCTLGPRGQRRTRDARLVPNSIPGVSGGG